MNLSLNIRIFTNENFIKALKAACACCISVLLAEVLDLKYTTSAGIITLLSLQDTKKETMETALKRFLSFLVAVLIAFISFRIFGYTLLGLGVYLVFFVLFCNVFSFQNAIAMCSVLIAHFWVEQSMEIQLIINELLLILIGAGIGILFNMFLPRYISAIRKDQRKIDSTIAHIVKHMASIMVGYDKEIGEALSILKDLLHAARHRANIAVNNTMTIDLRYYVQYIDMRKNQFIVLKRIEELLNRLDVIPIQAYQVAQLFDAIAASFHEYNNADELLKKTEEIRQVFRKDPLPQTRSEFEARATLFQILNDIEYFLILKNIFAKELTEEQKDLFWLNEKYQV